MKADTKQKSTCPVCGRPAEQATRPFCSPRCRSVDLGRWMGGTYAIPGAPVADDADESER
ncbi:DNA gyrase inhibitor YacG [Roseomonas sp. SSH11]|uniref:DNA gyrase inhibitor YacG n=1 Tax=Pararoseomonas baculiformis TaxID=2820812 RepID=A0ABS4AI53_9PROT|nr:DNA gyrase inhibitor YacG [Pararoseomonas baculiformis]MBP0446717.1 DNA gyrase inhibitor YacG [Pararoseomonas baculiformis]